MSKKRQAYLCDNSYSYDIWGNIVSQTESIAQPFRYSGEMFDDSTGLQYLRARWYDPSMGRFINEDTYEGQINNPLSLNLYTYVSNNPLTHTDPTGHCDANSMTGVADCVADFTPVMGSVKAGYEVVTGENPVTGEELSTAERVESAVGLIPEGKYLVKGVKWVGKGIKNVFSKGEKVAEAAAKACNCFVSGTKVQTDEGEKNIEDIEVGDKVLSKNEETGEQAYKEVTALHRNLKDTTYKLSVDNQIIETTDNHPFWVDGKGWTLAIDLKVGDELVQSNGNHLKIDNIETVHHDEKVKVYNFTVSDFHTYFVSDLGIWVHNINSFCGTSSDLANLANSSKSIDGLADVKASANVVNDAALEFVGKGAKIQKFDGGMFYTSKDGLKSVRTGVKYGKSAQQGTTVYEANFEIFDNNGKQLTNYHVDIE